MPRTWVIAIAAALGLVAVLLLFRGPSRKEADEVGVGDERPGRLAGRDAPGRGRESAAAAVRERLASRSPNRRADTGSYDSSAPDDIDTAVDRARERAAGGGGQRGRSMAGSTGSADPELNNFGDDPGTADGTTAGTTAGIAAGDGSAAGGAPGAGAKPGTHGDGKSGSKGTSETVSEAAPAGKPGADDSDPNGPAITLKFDKSTMPDKGDVAPIVESGVTIDDRGAHFSEGAQFAIPPAESVTGQAATISFWVVPDWDGDPESNASFFQWRTGTFENRVQIFKNGRYLRFIFTDNTGQESGVGTDISTWRAGEGHVVTATWGDGITAMYIDGASVGYHEYNGELQMPAGTGYLIGSDFNGGAPGAGGSIRDFHIYPRSLSADEVASLAAQSRH